MRDLLPPLVIDLLRDRYLAGVADAEAQFASAVADEDALTGALGQSIAHGGTYGFLVGDERNQFSVTISWKKLRGRGLNAPEKLYGPDGLFQIEVIDEFARVVRRKALPFQAKTNWRGTSKAVFKQSRDIENSLGGGIMVNFSDHGYEACTTKAALAGNGNRLEVKKGRGLRPLGQFLAEDFLNCTVGRQGLFFDTAEERFYGLDAAGAASILPPANAITTIVRRTAAE